MSNWWAVGERAETTMVSTTEPEHQHYCEECGQVWSHCDEACPGPRFSGRMHLGASWVCPLCDETGQYD
jgi:hypothetical protein